MFGPAVQCLFRLGVLPQNEDFVELTEEERNLYFKHNQRTDEKVFRLKLLVEDSLYTDNVVCMTEIEKETLLNAVEFINKYGKDKTFSTNEDKLRYVASRLPEIFSKGTKFEISD